MRPTELTESEQIELTESGRMHPEHGAHRQPDKLPGESRQKYWQAG